MIKELQKEDLKTIELLESSFSNTYKKDELKTRFSTNIFSKGFIYILESNIIGYIIYDEIYDRYEIINIEVKEQFRNQSIGSKLLEKIINIAADKKATNITLEVKKSNDRAIHLYSKYGFKKIAIRNDYYKGEDGILMEKKW